MSNCFEIEAVVPYQDGFGLIGRCIRGPIQLGDVFVKIFNTQSTSSENHKDSINHKEFGKINLVVREIQFFDHIMEELQSNHSGGLYVIGSGVELLQQGSQIET